MTPFRSVNRLRRIRRRRGHCSGHRLWLETLESRLVLSYTLSGGHLIVNGDDGAPRDDTITLGESSSGGVLLEMPGIIASFTPGQVQTVDINPGGGTNLVNLNEIPGGVDVTVNSSSTAFSDIVTLGTGPKNLDLLAGQVHVNGNGGNQPSTDTVILNDSNNLNTADYTVTKSAVARANAHDNWLNTTVLTYSAINRLTLIGSQFDDLSGGTSGDEYNVPSTADALYRFQGDGAFDTFSLGTGQLTALAGEETVVDDSLFARVTLDDSANSLNGGFDVEPATATGGIPAASISSDGFHALVQSPIPVNVFAGSGDTTFFLTALNKNLDALTNGFLFDGEGGNNSLVVNDTAAPATEQYQVGSTSFSRSGGPAVTLQSIESVTVDGGNHGANFGVLSTANGDSVTLNMGTGFNTVTVGGPDDNLGQIQGLLTVFGSGLGFTQLTLDDRASSSGRQYIIQSDRVLFGFLQVDFLAIEALTIDGANSANTFIFQSTAPAVSTTINSGTAGDQVQTGGSLIGNVAPIQGPVTVNGQANTVVTVFDQSTSTPQMYNVNGFTNGVNLTRTTSFGLFCTNIKSLTVNGGSGGNQFLVGALPPIPVTLNSGSGKNTLTGPDNGGHATTWVVSGAGSGKIGKTVAFNDIHDLAGNAGKDLFQINAGGSVPGTIIGGGSDDELEYATQTGPVTVNLQTRAAPQIDGGAPGGFSGIQVFIGSKSATDTLIGPDTDITWTVSTATGGFATGSSTKYTFTRFENLVGGAGVDTFLFKGNGKAATVDGGGAPANEGNWLDYSAMTTPVTVNLLSGAATSVGGGVSGNVANIQNVHGGSGGNTLVGNAEGNILIGGGGADSINGGTGPSILIGDAGADSLTGGSGADILIGDTTSFDLMRAANQKALAAILAEWQSADSYATRFTDIDTGTGGGLNSTFKLNFGTTVKSDGSADTLTAAPSAQALDWFFQGTGDTLSNVEPGEHINNNTLAAFLPAGGRWR